MTLNLHTSSPAVLGATPRHQTNPAPLIRTISTKSITPTLAFQWSRWKENCILLDGTMGGWFEGSFSLLGGDPFARFQSKGKSSRFDLLQEGARNRSFVYPDAPMTALQFWLNRFRPSDHSTHNAEAIPFLQGGVVGYFSYELAQQFEKLPQPREGQADTPDISLLFLNLFILADHRKDALHIVYNPVPEIRMGKEEKAAINQGLKKINALEKRIRAKGPLENEGEKLHTIPRLKSDCSPEEYKTSVRRAKAYIAQGEIFQANLSHRFTAPAPIQSPFRIYQGLGIVNPSPFSSYLEIGDFKIASSSPERLVRVKNQTDGALVETRPIAGTKPRGKNPSEDKDLVESLYGSEKERAEHLMLVDLERNDLGKISEYGSVRVDAFMALERYSHVSHLVSNIRGKLRPGLSPLQVLQAVFPGGTITGTPKIRCMEIIAELEKRARGIYTGSIGYIGFDGEMDLNIAIRTCVQHQGQLSFQVGAGIVADSDPALEYQETLHKAAAFIEVINSL